MKIASINTHGLAGQTANNRVKINGIFNFIIKSKFDIVCFQETHLVSETKALIIFKDFVSQGKFYFSNGPNGRSCGVAIWVANHSKCQVIDEMHDQEGRIISILAQIGNININVVNIYAPNNGRERVIFLRDMSNYLFTNVNGSLKGEPVILGDFNFVEDPDLDTDRKGAYARGEAIVGRKQMLDLKNEYGMCDIFRVLNPNIHKYTYFSQGYNSSSRIDIIYCSQFFKSLVTKCDVYRCPQSDHDYVYCQFHTDTALRGPGVWKLNNDILNDNKFKDIFTTFWTAWQQQKGRLGDIQTWWDLGKIKIKSLCREYCRNKRVKQDEHLVSMRQEYTELLDERDRSPDSGVPEERLEYLRTGIMDLESKQMEGTIIRSRIRYREEGEKCSKYFIDLEKRNAVNKTIDSLRSTEGELLIEPEAILKEQVRFYTELYTDEGVDATAQDILLNNLDKELPDSYINKCEGVLSLEEATKAIRALKNNKSPGHDGLSAEFYKTFWDILGPDFIAVSNAAFDKGILTVSQRRGMIVLMFKKGDKLNLKNWRPISLLNTDYKIITKCLANRLRQVLHTIINPDQTCSVPGRSIEQTTSFIRDLIEYVNQKNLPGAIICIDQMKAFDRVDWSFLLKTLHKFGFGPNFIQWVKLCYTDIFSAMHTNGFLSTFFKLERGTRQGCPLSALLYVLIAEVFSVNVRKEDKIRGITLPDGTVTKIDQYADDTTIQISDIDSIESVFSLIRVYELASGCRINMDKTEGLWLGSFKGRRDTPLDLRWTSDSVKILGFHLGNNDTSQLNWKPRVDKFKTILRSWNRRTLSYKGKIVILNSLASAGIWYYSNIVSIPDWAEKQINRESLEFLWNYKKHLVNKHVIKQRLDEGGLGLVDISLKIKAQRIKYISHLFTSRFSDKWQILADYFIGLYRGSCMGRIILKSYIFPRAANIINMPTIYKDCLRAWHSVGVINTKPPSTMAHVLDTPIFLNTGLTLGNKRPLFNADFITNGLRTVGDLINDADEFMEPASCLHRFSIESNAANILLLGRIIEYIPHQWKRALINDQQGYETADYLGVPDPDQKGGVLLVSKFNTRRLYLLMLKKTTRDATVASLRRWKAVFHNDNLTAKQMFSGTHSHNMCNLVSDLQWKSIHRVLTTNRFLNQCELIESAECSLCGNTDETILHTFTSCPNATVFWVKVRPIFNKLVHVGGNPLGTFNICFGFSHLHKRINEKSISLANYLLFTAKHCIWVARCLKKDGKNTDPFPIFRNKIKNRIMEEYVSYSEQGPGSLTIFDNRWCSNKAVCWLDGLNLIHFNM